MNNWEDNKSLDSHQFDEDLGWYKRRFFVISTKILNHHFFETSTSALAFHFRHRPCLPSVSIKIALMLLWVMILVMSPTLTLVLMNIAQTTVQLIVTRANVNLSRIKNVLMVIKQKFNDIPEFQSVRDIGAQLHFHIQLQNH